MTVSMTHFEQANKFVWAAVVSQCNGQGGQPVQVKGRRRTHALVGALKACSRSGDLESGRRIHVEVIESGYESHELVGTSLVSMYAKCGSMLDAQDVFDRLPRRDVVCWNSLIMGYSQNEQGEVGLQLYARMTQECVSPNARTFVGVLKACSSLAQQEEGTKVRCLEKGKSIHSKLVALGFHSDLFVGTTLLDVYAKCGSMLDARHLFHKLPQRDVVSWNTIILGYAQNGQGELALEMFASMRQQGAVPNARTFVAALKACTSLAALEEPTNVRGRMLKIRCLETAKSIHAQLVSCGFGSDAFVGATLVDLYAKCGSMLDARHVFDKLSRRDVVSWTAVILGYAHNEEGELALHFFGRMRQEGVTPDAPIFVAALKACSSLAALEEARQIHAQIRTARLDGNTIVAATLIDVYGKCGSMREAQLVFDALPSRSLVTWTALIAGYARHGHSQLVFQMFEEMKEQGIQPDNVTILTILTVCTHAGQVDKGKKYFEDMFRDHGIVPTLEHHICLVDLVGRAGQVEEAVAMVKKMPFRPNLASWMTVLGACQKWNDVEAGRYAFESAVRLHSKNPGPYVLMSNIYEDAHMWEDRDHIQAMRKSAKAWKTPGQSWWTQVGGIVHTFLVGDARHPQTQHIYAKLNDLSVHMKEEESVRVGLC